MSNTGKLVASIEYDNSVFHYNSFTKKPSIKKISHIVSTRIVIV